MLSFARSAIRVANMANWLIGAVVAVVLLVMLFDADRIRDILAEDGFDPANYSLMVGALALVLPVVLLVHAIFVRLLALIDTADTDHCFTEANAGRLIVIAWCLVGINVIDLAFGGLDLMSGNDRVFDWFPTLTGWFAALMLFVLAGIFRRGAAMRDDLEGTV